MASVSSDDRSEDTVSLKRKHRDDDDDRRAPANGGVIGDDHERDKNRLFQLARDVMRAHSFKNTKTFFDENPLCIRMSVQCETILAVAAHIATCATEKRYANYWMSVLRLLMKRGARFAVNGAFIGALSVITTCTWLRYIYVEAIGRCVSTGCLEDARNSLRCAFARNTAAVVHAFICCDGAIKKLEASDLSNIIDWPDVRVSPSILRSFIKANGFQSDGTFLRRMVDMDEVDVVDALHAIVPRWEMAYAGMLVAHVRSINMLRLLLRLGYTVRDENKGEFQCERGPLNHVDTTDRNVVKALLDAGMTAVPSCELSSTVLEQAAKRGDSELVDKLIAAGARCDAWATLKWPRPALGALAAHPESTMHTGIQLGVDVYARERVCIVSDDECFRIGNAIRSGFVPSFRVESWPLVGSGNHTTAKYESLRRRLFSLFAETQQDFVVEVESVSCIKNMLPSDCIQMIVDVLYPKPICH